MSAGSLYNHMLKHKGERSYMCRFCAKQFLTAGQLKVHERSHTQEKAFVCNVHIKSLSIKFFDYMNIFLGLWKRILS